MNFGKFNGKFEISGRGGSPHGCASNSGERSTPEIEMWDSSELESIFLSPVTG